MKAIVSDSLSHLTLNFLPTDQKTCSDLLFSIIGGAQNVETFKPTLVAAELIFDEVTYSSRLDVLDPDFGYAKRDAVRDLLSDLEDGPHAVLSRPWLGKTQPGYDDTFVDVGAAFEALLPEGLRKGTTLQPDEILLSPDPLLNQIAGSGTHRNTDGEMLLRLASSGVHFAMPALAVTDIDVIREFREKHNDLRAEYLTHWQNIFRICRISEDDDAALADLLKSEIRRELRSLSALCTDIEKAAVASDQGRLERLRKLPVSDGVPGLFSAALDVVVTGSVRDLAEEVVTQFVRLFKAWKAPEAELRGARAAHPAATYIYEMKQLAAEA